MTLSTTDLKGELPLVARGKVRDLYSISKDSILFVATDRISAYDVVMENGIPSKGKLLTKLSKFWFSHLKPLTKNHLIEEYNGSDDDIFKGLPESLSNNDELRQQLISRSLLVKKFKILPLEVIVRGYITGSAWNEYRKHGTVHGMKVKDGLQESEKFDAPLYTPSMLKLNKVSMMKTFILKKQ